MSREHHVGVARGIAEEEIDAGKKLEFLERLARALGIGMEMSGLKLIDISPLISPRSIASMISQAVSPCLGSSGSGCPKFRDELAVLGLVDVASARELVVALAVFTSALAVALAGDGA